ncbi:MAG: hypothetical protein JWO98_2456 [Frankiales bacterium]|nr:hypothetical protein [Frankiales bacterium]
MGLWITLALFFVIPNGYLLALIVGCHLHDHRARRR